MTYRFLCEVEHNFNTGAELVVVIVNHARQILHLTFDMQADIVAVTPLHGVLGAEKVSKHQHIVHSSVFIGAGFVCLRVIHRQAVGEQIYRHGDTGGVMPHLYAVNERVDRVHITVDITGCDGNEGQSGLCNPALPGEGNGGVGKERLGQGTKQFLCFVDSHACSPFPTSAGSPLGGLKSGVLAVSVDTITN